MTRQRQNALIIIIVLAAVLAAALVGRDYLARRRMSEATVATEEQTLNEASAEQPTTDVLLLEDYNATVYTDLGEPLRLTDIADGKPLVINFWATWCPYCVDELPDFQQLVAAYGDQVNFAFVDVADGQREKAEDAAAWLHEQGFDDLPAYYDTSQEAAATFGAYALPTTVVVAANGEILTVSAGRIDVDLMRGALESLV